MKIIKEADKVSEKLWKTAAAGQGQYRLFTFLFTISVDGGSLIHHGVTGEMIFLSDAEMARINALPGDYDAWMDELIEKHFLVKADADDMKTVDSLRKVSKLVFKKNEITSYTVLPTTSCNARCFYCYEANCEHHTMTDETADKLVEYIEAHHAGKKVYISWFGGEPLVGIKQIDRILKSLAERGIEFNSSMVSNGYLFDAEVARHAKEEWKLGKIQITLDGTEEVYNKTKAYVNACESPYRRVLDNIDHLLDNDIYVTVRLNLGMHNDDDLNVLVEELAERFGGRENFSVYSHMLFDDCGFVPTHFDNEEDEALTLKQEELKKKIWELGLGSPGKFLPKLKIANCMADGSSSVTVVPTGDLGKCEHYVDSNFVGDLDSGITNEEQMKFYSETVVFPKCETCPHYPSCIKLKCCETGNACKDAEMRFKTEAVEKTMRYVYEEHLKKE